MSRESIKSFIVVSMSAIYFLKFVRLSRRSVISRLILSVVVCLLMGSSYVGVFSSDFVLDFIGMKN